MHTYTYANQQNARINPLISHQFQIFSRKFKYLKQHNTKQVSSNQLNFDKINTITENKGNSNYKKSNYATIQLANISQQLIITKLSMYIYKKGTIEIEMRIKNIT